MSGAIDILKEMKHRAWLAKRDWTEKRKVHSLLSTAAKQPYVYDPVRYSATVDGVIIPSSSTFLVDHLAHAEVVTFHGPPPKAPNQMFVIWFGGEMSENRQRGIAALQRANPSLQLHVISEENYRDWILDEAPIHPAFQYLSFVHRSDYLRTYFMHHYGGAYADVKAVTIDVATLLDILNSDDELWAIGPSEINYRNVSRAVGDGLLGEDQETYFQQLLWPAYYVCRPNTPFTSEHLREIERRLSYFRDILEQHPAEQPWGSNADYPVAWNAIHGQIFSPLCLKYHDHIEAIPGILNTFGPHR